MDMLRIINSSLHNDTIKLMVNYVVRGYVPCIGNSFSITITVASFPGPSLEGVPHAHLT